MIFTSSHRRQSPPPLAILPTPGGLDWPYISDTGREKPEYYIFSIFLTIAALLYAATMVLAYGLLMSGLSSEHKHHRRWADGARWRL